MSSSKNEGAPKPQITFNMSTKMFQGMKDLSDAKGVTMTEIMRRSFTLYQFYQSLRENQELVVRDKKSGEVERLIILE